MAPPNLKTTGFSERGIEAKKATIQDFKDEILQELVDHWYELHPSGNPPPSSENVRKKLEELTHPPTDSTGVKPKYVTMPNGKKLPTEETMEAFGNASARAVDNGTQVLGMNWLSM